MRKKSIKKAILMIFAIIMLAVQISVCVSALNATPSEYEISDEHSSMAMATSDEPSCKHLATYNLRVGSLGCVCGIPRNIYSVYCLNCNRCLHQVIDFHMGCK